MQGYGITIESLCIRGTARLVFAWHPDRPMPRPDLMALSPDDLAVLTNRGRSSAAVRELESGEVTGELDEAPTAR